MIFYFFSCFLCLEKRLLKDSKKFLALHTKKLDTDYFLEVKSEIYHIHVQISLPNMD